MAHAIRTRTPAALAVSAALVFAGSVWLAAQGAPQPAAPAQTPLTFQAVMDLAVANNLELAAVRRARAVRAAEVRAAGQWANPEFTAEATRDTPHGDLAIGYPVDIGGVRSRRVAVAKEELAMADIDEAAAMKALRRRGRLAFYGLLAADEQIALAENVLKVAERVQEVAQARFEEGAAPKLDVMAADLGVVRARTDLDLARSERRSAQAELNALLNRPPGMAIALAGASTDIPAIPTMDAALAAALASNIDLRAAEREIAIEGRRLALLKAERIPMPTLTAGVVLNAPGEFDAGAHGGIGLTIPLFTRNQGEIAGSMARADTIRAHREAIGRQVEAAVFTALEKATTQRAQVEAFRTSLVPTATSIQTLAEESYKLGRDSILVALAAQRSLRDVKYEYLQALQNLHAAIADLEDILGTSIQ